MKKISWLFPALALFFIACNNSGKESGSTVDSSGTTTVDTSNNNNNQANNTVDQPTSVFMTKAADGGMSEVQMGQIAQQKGSNQRVKDFGSMMVNDHSKANDELKSIAGQKSVTLPDSISAEHKKMMTDLQKKKGKDFDKAYIDMMVDDHQKDVSEFEKASNETKNPDVKSWIDKTLPTLRMHLDSAKAIQGSLKH
jgi:putative membrane protein